MRCRFCSHPLQHVFIDLVNSPPSNGFLTARQLNEPETFYPLKLFVCESCWLVQVEEYKKAGDLFGNQYAYFSSYSASWLAHMRRFVQTIIGRFGIDATWQVIEVASNDGYLLQYFKERQIPVLGIEPAANVAGAAREKGIETRIAFFGSTLAAQLVDEGTKADLLIGNNVLAHVPDVNDFVRGMKIVLSEQGVITMEFPHLMRLVEQHQFDTIYHEHFSYLSFHAACAIFEKHGLEIFDVQEIPTHGGSLRIYAKHKEDPTRRVCPAVARLLTAEQNRGMTRLAYYQGFQQKADAVKYALLRFLIDQRQKGRKVAAYGAAAKGNTLLNYCGVKPDLIAFVVDASPHKQGKYLPGSHIPVVEEARIRAEKPAYILVLPWNIKEEIMEQLSYVRDWQAKFVIPVPALEVL